MPLALLVVSLMIGAALAEQTPLPSPTASRLFASPPPEAVDDFSQWEMVDGEFENGHATGSFRFYVAPRHAALYQIMRYRITFRPPLSPEESRNHPTEKLVWNREPGRAAPLVCWERMEAAKDAPAHWRELSAGTPEYNQEMRVLIQVLYLHQSARKPAEPRKEGEP